MHIHTYKLLLVLRICKNLHCIYKIYFASQPIQQSVCHLPNQFEGRNYMSGAIYFAINIPQLAIANICYQLLYLLGWVYSCACRRRGTCPVDMLVPSLVPDSLQQASIRTQQKRRQIRDTPSTDDADRAQLKASLQLLPVSRTAVKHWTHPSARSPRFVYLQSTSEAIHNTTVGSVAPQGEAVRTYIQYNEDCELFDCSTQKHRKMYIHLM